MNSYFIIINIIRLVFLFYIGETIRSIFYDDRHVKNKYNDTSTPIELFIRHIRLLDKVGLYAIYKVYYKYIK